MALASSSSLSSPTYLPSPQSLPRFPSSRSYSSSSRFAFPSLRTNPFSSSVPAWKYHVFFAQRAAQAETKEVEGEQNTDASDSDYESSDEENDGTASQESSRPSIAELLKCYKDAISGGDDAALTDVESKLLSVEKERETYAKQVLSLSDEVATVKDRLLRLNADFDNFRKRSERERLAVSTNVKGDVVNSLLPMVDNFERAKTQIKIENEGEKRIDSSYQGIYKQFVEIMKGLGVAAVETVGKQFDPNVHEAIMREESAQYPEGVIIEEFRRGFILGDKLLRPAMVKVSSGPGAVNADEAVEEQISEADNEN